MLLQAAMGNSALAASPTKVYLAQYRLEAFSDTGRYFRKEFQNKNDRDAAYRN